MRIAIVTPSYPPDAGGVAMAASHLAGRLALAGHHVEVLAHSAAGSASVEIREGVVIRWFRTLEPYRALVISPGLLAHAVRHRRQFDVVHAHNFHASAALGAAVAGMRPLVLSPYYHERVQRSRVTRLAYRTYRPASRVLLAASGQIVCGSSAEARAFVRDAPPFAAPVSVIPHGVDVTRLAAAEPFASEGRVVVAAGRIQPYKQLDRVALAARSLPDDHQLVLLGDGPGRSELQRLIQRQGLRGRVRSLGHVSDDDLQRWFRTAEVVVTMSRHESFGLTLIEGLAAGARVVASDIPAHREIAESQPPGAVRLVAVDASPGEIADAIASASGERAVIEPRLNSWDEVAERYLAIYTALL